MANEEKFLIQRWVFTPGRNSLSDGKTKHRLEDRASRVLEYLCQNPGKVVSKEELIDHVWQGRHLSEQSVPVVISNLRKALAGGDREAIETIPKKGYRLLDAKPINEAAKNRMGSLVIMFLAFVAVLTGVYLFLSGEESNARKPGVVLTLNDIQNGTGKEDLMPMAIALSEAGSHFLSKADGILLIRHWWNLDQDDPSGGIFERYGEDAPVYHINGTLVSDGNQLAVTLFLNDPKTSEVLWSEAYTLNEDHPMAAHLEGLGKILAFLGLKEQIPPPGEVGISKEATSSYWLGLYFWNLETEGAADIAAEMWQKALTETPNLEAAKLGQAALAARWPNSFPNPDIVPRVDPAKDDPALLVQAGTIALYADKNVDKAVELAREALKKSPNDFTAYALLAESLVLQGKIKEALMAIREARLLAPFSTVYPERETEYSKLLEAGD